MGLRDFGYLYTIVLLFRFRCEDDLDSGLKFWYITSRQRMLGRFFPNAASICSREDVVLWVPLISLELNETIVALKLMMVALFQWSE